MSRYLSDEDFHSVLVALSDTGVDVQTAKRVTISVDGFEVESFVRNIFAEGEPKVLGVNSERVLTETEVWYRDPIV